MRDARPKIVVSWPGLIGCLAVLLVGGAALYLFAFMTCNPADRVTATFRHVPAGTVWLSVVAEADGKLDNMYWYPYPMSTAVHPAEARWLQPDVRTGVGRQNVQWKQGTRYGVVAQREDKSWWVTWFDADEVPVEGRQFFFGGGSVEFDLARGRTEAFPREQAEELGLHDPRLR